MVFPSPPPAWHGNFGSCSCPSVNGSWPRPLIFNTPNQYKSPSYSSPLFSGLSCVHWGRYLLFLSTSGAFPWPQSHIFVHSPLLSCLGLFSPVHLATCSLSFAPLPLLHSSPWPRGGRPKTTSCRPLLACLSQIPFHLFLLILPTQCLEDWLVHWPPWRPRGACPPGPPRPVRIWAGGTWPMASTEAG